MKKLLALSLVSSSIFLGANSVKADWNYIGVKKNIDYVWEDESKRWLGNPYGIWTLNSQTGEKTLLTNFCIEGASCEERSVSFLETGEIYVPDKGAYNLSSDTWRDHTIDNSWSSGFSLVERPILDGLIDKKSDGSIHIGENSAVFKEENGREKFWAQDANGKSIPIDITNGSKLLINGRDVEQSINNVGALSAALTGLPTIPTDTTLACGLGTGTHGGDFAFSGGCASKLNEKLSINYAASMTMPGQDYAGDLEDKFSARAGFVWKLGKSNQPTQISIKAKEEMEDKINSLEEKNEKILSKNKNLENTVSILLARLERLEKVAFSEAKSKDLATIKLP